MTDECRKDKRRKRHAPCPFIMYSMDENAAAKEAGSKLTAREIGMQWNTLPKVAKKKYFDMSSSAKEELAKEKSLLPPEPKRSKNQSRVALNSIVAIVKNFDELQREAVKDIGLGGLLELRCTTLDRKLCKWLVDNFDPNSSSLHVHGKTLVLDEAAVHNALGIRAQGELVDIRGSRKGYPKLCTEVGVDKGVVKLKGLADYLQGTKEDGDKFKSRFALYILGAFLCPTTRPAVRESFVHAVVDVQAMKHRNWAKITITYLCNAIRKCRTTKCQQSTGCLFLLQVLYLERVRLSGSDVMRKRLVPYLAGWGNAEIKEKLRELQDMGGYENKEVEVCIVENEEETEYGSPINTQSQVEIGDMKTDICDMKTSLSRIESLLNRLVGTEWQEKVKNDTATCTLEVVHKNPTNPIARAAVSLVENVPLVQVDEPKYGYPSVEMRPSSTSHRKDRPQGIGGKKPPTPPAVSTPNQKDRGPVKSVEKLHNPPDVSMSQTNVTHLPRKVQKSHSPPVVLPPSGSRRGRKRKRITTTPISDMGINEPKELPPAKVLYQRPKTRGPEMLRKSHVLLPPFTSMVRSKNKTKTEAAVAAEDDHPSPRSDDSEKAKFEKLNALLVSLTSKLADPEDYSDFICPDIKHLPYFHNSPDYALLPRPIPLNFEERLLVEFCFDDAREPTQDVLVAMEFNRTVLATASRSELCNLKPRKWIIDTVIDLVAVQRTNSERHLSRSSQHSRWFFPTFVSRKILLCNGSDDDLQELADSFFGEYRYTGTLDACQKIYMPVNDNNLHWFCLMVDMGNKVAEIFDSMPLAPQDACRERMAKKLVDGLHKMLEHHYGNLYDFNVSSFVVRRLEKQPLQGPSDTYDCGMFVIKYMQGFEYDAGIRVCEDIERPRLLVDFFVDVNNTSNLAVLDKFKAWKGRQPSGHMAHQSMDSILW